jgi:NAD(P) transhydrogenase subunit beta
VLLAGALIGGAYGLYSARTVQMTNMPQLVSLFNAVGGGAAALIAIDDYFRLSNAIDACRQIGANCVLPVTSSIPLEVSVPTVLDILIGGVCFTGSVIASGTLEGVISG